MIMQITVNKRTKEIDPDFGETPQQFAESVGYSEDKTWEVYRVPKTSTGKSLARHVKCSAPMSVSSGEEFVIIPKYINDG